MDVVTLKLANQYTDASGGGGGSGSGGNVPEGGNEGQVLTKRSDANYDAEWQNIPAADWNNLQNRPFGYEYAFIDWDGNTEAKEVIDGNYYKVYDAQFPVDYVGAFIFVNGEVWEITHDMVSYGEEYTDVSVNGKVYIKEAMQHPFGVYFLNDGTEYVERVERSYIRKIDPNFIDTMNPDWNDNDPNSQRYINGRTHWTEYNYAEPVEFAESELSWQDTGATLEDVPILKAEGTNDLIPDANITLGQYVVVGWGDSGGYWTAIAYDPSSYGIEYEGGVLMGNPALHPDLGADFWDSGEPYLILLRGNEYIMYTRETQIPSPSVVLDVMSETVYPLEEKYIPYSIMRTADVDAAVDTALQGKIVQSDIACADKEDPAYIKNNPFTSEFYSVAGVYEEYNQYLGAFKVLDDKFPVSFSGSVVRVEMQDGTTSEIEITEDMIFYDEPNPFGYDEYGNRLMRSTTVVNIPTSFGRERIIQTNDSPYELYFTARNATIQSLEKTVSKLNEESYNGNVGSDLRVNDEENAAYVKGRTHWVEGELEKTATIELTRFNLAYQSDTDGDGEYTDERTVWMAEGVISEESNYMRGGVVYRVHIPTMSGEPYLDLRSYPETTTADYFYLGNRWLQSFGYNGEPDTGEDYLVVLRQGTVSAHAYFRSDYFTEAPTSFSFEITRDTRVYHPLDDNFIPETIARKEPVDTAIAQIVSTLQNAKKHTFGMVYFEPTVDTDVEIRMLSSIYRENSHFAIEWEDKMFNAMSIFKVKYALNFEADAEASFTINSASIDFGTQGKIPAGKSQHIVEFIVDVPLLSGGSGNFTLNDLKFNCTGAVTLKDSYYTVEEYQMG